MIGRNQCNHGNLKRVCEICELEAERETLKEELKTENSLYAKLTDRINDVLTGTSQIRGGEMSFTDEDLKFLKDMIDHNNKNNWKNIMWSNHKLESLVARLEAAEVCAIRLIQLQDTICEEDMSEKIIETWKKASGK